MKIIEPKNFNVKEIFQSCANSMHDPNWSLEEIFINAENDYNKGISRLPSFPDNKKDKNHNALKEIYDKLIQNQNPKKKYYNKIMASVPDDICPYCLVSPVTTLDHYLPKGTYSQLSIVPKNLVPSCRDCNTSKGGINGCVIHPYLDSINEHLLQGQWLSADVNEADEVSLNFYISPLNSWDNIFETRMKKHFKTFKLNERYRTLSSQLLCETNARMLKLADAESRKKALNEEKKVITNSSKIPWKIATYDALLQSDWYLNEYNYTSIYSKSHIMESLKKDEFNVFILP